MAVLKTTQTVLGTLWAVLVLVMLCAMELEMNERVHRLLTFLAVQGIIILSKIGIYFLVLNLII